MSQQDDPDVVRIKATAPTEDEIQDAMADAELQIALARHWPSILEIARSGGRIVPLRVLASLHGDVAMRCYERAEKLLQVPWNSNRGAASVAVRVALPSRRCVQIVFQSPLRTSVHISVSASDDHSASCVHLRVGRAQRWLALAGSRSTGARAYERADLLGKDGPGLAISVEEEPWLS